MNAGNPGAADPLHFLYDVNALCCMYLFVFAATIFLAVRALRSSRDWVTARDLLAVCLISAVPRVAFFQKTTFRPAHHFLELFANGPDVNYAYPLSFPALIKLVTAIGGGRWDRHEVSWHVGLALGILTPALFYFVSFRLVPNRKLAWTMALLLALNPAHVMFSGPYDFSTTSIFTEVLSHLLLLLFFQTRRPIFLAVFIPASFLFYLSRPENSAVFYLHAVCLLYAWRILPESRRALATCTAVFFSLNLIYQHAWWASRSYEHNHAVGHLWYAPLSVLGKLPDVSWDHFIDWQWCPPYLLPLLILGIWRIARAPELIHAYPLALLAIFLLVYGDIESMTIHRNARYFVNPAPATFLVIAAGLEWMYERWERAPAWVMSGIAAMFLAFVPALAHNTYLTQDEWAFYWDEAREARPAVARVWIYSMSAGHWDDYVRAERGAGVITPAVAESFLNEKDYFYTEFEDGHLFNNGEMTPVFHEAGDLRPGDYLFLGASCYQLVVGGDSMLPDCTRQLTDPRNEVVKSHEYPARPFHTRAPWIVSGTSGHFRTATFYLLRRRAPA